MATCDVANWFKVRIDRDKKETKPVSTAQRV
jgi:hypothetical protein